MAKANYFETAHGTRLAYHLTEGSSPGVIFLGGFMSDMEGGKATMLEAYCSARGQAFLRFDYQGHGESDGAFADGTIGLWAQDALAVIDGLTEGPQILVGSSMGGWVALLAAKARPSRVRGLVGIAAAPDFTTRMWQDELTDQQRETIIRDGLVEVPTDYGPDPYTLTKGLFDDGWANRVIHQPLHLDVPMRLIQGTEDPDVPWQTVLDIADAVTSDDVEIILVPGGDHRLSEKLDLKRLKRVVRQLSMQLKKATL